MLCSKCGGKIPPNSKFCLHCGEKILEAPQPTLEPSESDIEITIHGVVARVKNDPISRRRLLEGAKILYGWFQEEQTKKIDFSSRPILWTTQDNHTYHGELNSFIGEAKLDESRLFWNADVKCALRRFYQSDIFSILSDALDWMEKTINAAKDEPLVEPEPILVYPPPFELTDEYREKLAPYWIDPAVLEAEHVTYKPVIDLEHILESFETMTLPWGEKIQIKETYPSTATLAVRIGLVDAKLDFQEWPRGRYRITGLTHYYQAQQAIAFAQSLWDKSKIFELLKAGKITKARYGYREIETGYTEFVGECVAEGEFWYPHPARDAYLKELALRYTLSYALDVSGYRSLLQFSLDIPDDELLHDLHECRAECKYIPSNVSAESLQWLRAKELEDSKTKKNRNH